MKSPGKGKRNLILLTGFFIVACGALSILMNIPFGPDHRLVALGTGQPQILPIDRPIIDTVATATAAAGPFLRPSEKVDITKMAPPRTGCGLGDRYAIVCKDG